MNDGSSTASSDDLEIIKVTRRDLEKKAKPQGRSIPWETAQPGRERAGRSDALQGQSSEDAAKPGDPAVKVEWSDDESLDQRGISKHSESLKRKRPGRKPKAAKAAQSTIKERRRLEGLVSHDVDYQDSVPKDQSDDEDGIEVPEYILARRSKFDQRTKILKQSGLKLPPSYEDIEFSDDERLEHLAERPDFMKLQPPAAYQDKELHASLGLIPAPIAQWLRDYQLQGAAFMHKLFVYQEGGILGDDMGR